MLHEGLFFLFFEFAQQLRQLLTELCEAMAVLAHLVVERLQPWVHHRLWQRAERLREDFRQACTDYNISRMRMEELKRKQPEADAHGALPQSVMDPRLQPLNDQMRQNRHRFTKLCEELTKLLGELEEEKEQALVQHLYMMMEAQVRYFETAAGYFQEMSPSFAIMSPSSSSSSLGRLATPPPGSSPSASSPISVATSASPSTSHRPSLSRKTMVSPLASIVPFEATIWIGTWNVANAPPPPTLDPWIPTDGGHDIYAIGLQECEYKTTSLPCQEHFLSVVKKTLGREYYCVAAANIFQINLGRSAGQDLELPNVGGIGGIRLFVFARTVHKQYIKDIQSDKEATGVAGVGFNKGGVGVSLRFYDTRMCFVNCHLAAHQDKVEQRHQDVRDILMGLRLGNPNIEIDVQFQHIFWFGDLNYRLDLDRDTVLVAIKDKNIQKLLDHDQLLRERLAGHVLSDFSEAPITFRPTFKFERESNHYENTKLRVPSYCDRILAKSFDDRPLTQLEYNWAESVRTSDHRPVYATFATLVRNDHTILASLRQEIGGIIQIRLTDIDIQYPTLGEGSLVSITFHTFNFSSLALSHKTATPAWQGSVDIVVPVVDVVLFPHLFAAVTSARSALSGATASSRSQQNDRLGEGVIYLKNVEDTGISFGPPKEYSCRLFSRGFADGVVRIKLQMRKLL
eukprot:TRINITY_DN6954_c0_g1_i3.p1 TRINITY_DN6954_c0_g1~~TRINITY_DN6954_c0_g1_i3.p1  ORF type:complete len:684 (-),score=134.78 TRINITY_DN6954_c0_g1_i3:8-2059(-)